MKDDEGKDAPSFWYNPVDKKLLDEDTKSICDTNDNISDIEQFAKFLLPTSSTEMRCNEHRFVVSKKIVKSASVSKKKYKSISFIDIHLPVLRNVKQ